MMNVCTPEQGHQQLQDNRRRERDDRQGRTLMKGEHQQKCGVADDVWKRFAFCLELEGLSHQGL